MPHIHSRKRESQAIMKVLLHQHSVLANCHSPDCELRCLLSEPPSLPCHQISEKHLFSTFCFTGKHAGWRTSTFWKCTSHRIPILCLALTCVFLLHLPSIFLVFLHVLIQPPTSCPHPPAQEKKRWMKSSVGADCSEFQPRCHLRAQTVLHSKGKGECNHCFIQGRGKQSLSAHLSLTYMIHITLFILHIQTLFWWKIYR